MQGVAYQCDEFIPRQANLSSSWLTAFCQLLIKRIPRTHRVVNLSEVYPLSVEPVYESAKASSRSGYWSLVTSFNQAKTILCREF